MESRSDVFARILADKPKLHYWPNHGGWSYGGFDDNHLRWIFERLVPKHEAGSHATIETGAGLSTLVFLATLPSRHICICPDRELHDRVQESIRRFDLDAGRLEFVLDVSEEVLPDLTRSAEPFVDLALIDGGHGYPTPFVDFCYMNRVLRKGGTLLIDDIQIQPIHHLAAMLNEQEGWARLGTITKLALFEKQSAARYLPDFGAQPYVQRQRVEVKPSGGTG